MKLVARLATALALLAFATPALPCGAEKKTTTASETKKEQPVAEKKAAKTEKKAEKKQSSVKVEAPAETRTATAQ